MEKVSERPPKEKKRKLSYNEKKEYEQIEDVIMQLEEKISELQEAIVEAGSDSVKVQDLYAEQQKTESELESKMERWEELSLLVEEIENNK